MANGIQEITPSPLIKEITSKGQTAKILWNEILEFVSEQNYISTSLGTSEILLYQMWPLEDQMKV